MDNNLLRYLKFPPGVYTCARCRAAFVETTMSFFSTDMLCQTCHEDETLALNHGAARAAGKGAVRSGNPQPAAAGLAAGVSGAARPPAPAVKVGDYVRIAPTSPLARRIGYLRQVLDVFVREGVTFAVLTPKETAVPPIVRTDQLIRTKGAGTRARR
jgi:hypothetical protein